MSVTRDSSPLRFGRYNASREYLEVQYIDIIDIDGWESNTKIKSRTAADSDKMETLGQVGSFKVTAIQLGKTERIRVYDISKRSAEKKV